MLLKCWSFPDLSSQLIRKALRNGLCILLVGPSGSENFVVFNWGWRRYWAERVGGEVCGIHRDSREVDGRAIWSFHVLKWPGTQIFPSWGQDFKSLKKPKSNGLSYNPKIPILASNFCTRHIRAWWKERESFITKTALRKETRWGKKPEGTLVTGFSEISNQNFSDHRGGGLQTLTLAEAHVPVERWRALLHAGTLLENVAVHALQAVSSQRATACVATPITL